jgi:hypothetical protein
MYAPTNTITFKKYQIGAGRWRGSTPDLSTSCVTSSDLTLGEIKVRVSRGVRGSLALEKFKGRTGAVKEGSWKISHSNATGWGFASPSHGFGRKLPRLSPLVRLIVLAFAMVMEPFSRALRTARSGGSRRGAGRAGRDDFLILPSVTREAGGPTGTSISDEPPCRASRLARTGDSRSGGGRAGGVAFLVLSPVTLDEGNAGRLSRTVILGEGCETEGAGLKLLWGK